VKQIPKAEANLGEFEQLVLLAMTRLGPEAYGATIRRDIESRTGRDLAISAVYITLDRLEVKGLVRSRIGEPTPHRGGRRRKHFIVLPAGRRAISVRLPRVRTDGRRTGTHLMPRLLRSNGEQAPRLALWILRLRLPVEDREFAIGDLEEEFDDRVQRDGSAGAAAGTGARRFAVSSLDRPCDINKRTAARTFFEA
jgi:DNA-binding PadR family transcriptional regulator